MQAGASRHTGRALPAALVIAGLALGSLAMAPRAHAESRRPQVSVVVGFPPIFLHGGPVVVVPGLPAYDEYDAYEDRYPRHYHDHGDSDSDSDSDHRHRRHRHGRHCRH